MSPFTTVVLYLEIVLHGSTEQTIEMGDNSVIPVVGMWLLSLITGFIRIPQWELRYFSALCALRQVIACASCVGLVMLI